MNFRQPLLGLCTLGCGLLVMLSTASPARAAGTSIPIETRTGADAANSRPLIAAFAKAQIDQLSTPATLHDAREALIAPVLKPSGGQVLSGQFLEIYAQEISTQLTPLLAKQDASTQTLRLNAAIVVARVAEQVDNTRLMAITQQLLDDKSDAVKIWALRAARYVLPPAIQINQHAKLLAAIKGLAGPNANPMLSQLVYEALSPPVAPNAPGAPKIIAVVVPELQTLLAARVEQLRSDVPPDPLAVLPATNFLCQAAWKSCNAQQQLQTVQIISNMIAVAGERADAANGIDKNQMIELAQKIINSLQAAAFNAQATNVFNALQRAAAINSGVPKIVAVTSTIHPLLITFPAWAALAAPPHILPAGAAATTAPAAGATTAPVTAVK